MKWIKLSFYFPAWVICWLSMAALWEVFVAGKLYHCSDPLPIASFIPPFVHTGSSGTPITGDYFIASPVTVYGIWALMMITSFIGPVAIYYLAKLLAMPFKSRKDKT